MQKMMAESSKPRCHGVLATAVETRHLTSVPQELDETPGARGVALRYPAPSPTPGTAAAVSSEPPKNAVVDPLRRDALADQPMPEVPGGTGVIINDKDGMPPRHQG